MDKVLQKIPPAELGKTLEGVLQKSSLDSKEKEKLEKNYPVPFSICSFPEKKGDDDKKSEKSGYSSGDDSVKEAKEKEKSFIMCHHNKVAAGEYRSPWTNKVYKKDGIKTSTKSSQTDEMLLDLEKKFNNVWSAYAKLYYGAEAVSSCFLGETDDKKFQAAFCIHKSSENVGAWSSYHIVHMDDPTEKTCQYHVTSTVWLHVYPDCSDFSSTPTTMEASAHITKSVSKVMKIEQFFLTEFHLQNIGSIVEANEIEMRSNLEQVHIPKTKNIFDLIQKEPDKPKQVNPLMGMIMDSDVLKKKKLGKK